MEFDSVCVWLEKPLFGGLLKKKKVFGTPAMFEGLLFFSWEDPTGAGKCAMCEKEKGSGPSGGQGGRGLSAPPDSPRLGFSPIFHYMQSLQAGLPRGLQGPGDLEGQRLHFLEHAKALEGALELERKEQGWESCLRASRLEKWEQPRSPGSSSPQLDKKFLQQGRSLSPFPLPCHQGILDLGPTSQHTVS